MKAPKFFNTSKVGRLLGLVRSYKDSPDKRGEVEEAFRLEFSVHNVQTITDLVIILNILEE